MPDNLVMCPCCGLPAGFPNVKMAHAEAAFLSARADAARADALTRGADAALGALATALGSSLAVVNVDVEFLLQMLSSDKVPYTAYGKLIAAGARLPGAPDDDRNRSAVDGIVFGSWGTEIVFAALSLDGCGLGTYGRVSLELREVAISDRASVLEENSWDYVARHRIVAGDKVVPVGYRAPWGTRSEVGVAKLGSRVNATTTSADHPGLVLSSDGVDRRKDEFIEVHIFGSFNRRAIQRITVLQKPKTSGERQRLKDAKKTAKTLGIGWTEP